MSLKTERPWTGAKGWHMNSVLEFFLNRKTRVPFQNFHSAQKCSIETNPKIGSSYTPTGISDILKYVFAYEQRNLKSEQFGQAITEPVNIARKKYFPIIKTIGNHYSITSRLTTSSLTSLLNRQLWIRSSERCTFPLRLKQEAWGEPRVCACLIGFSWDSLLLVPQKKHKKPDII